MSISAIGSISNAASLAQTQPAAPTPKPAQASLQPDTVSLSAAAQKASQSGDVDHDGDSH
jgi:hypothetical protein